MIRLGAFDPNKDYSGKFCLMFHFKESYGIPHAHCTHKYLGAVDQVTLGRAIQVVESYFDKNKQALSAPRVWWFDRFSLLGKEKDTPVLERTQKSDMLLDLIGELDQIVPAQWDTYRPHVTVPPMYEFMRLPMMPAAYVLSEGGNAKAKWPMGGS